MWTEQWLSKDIYTLICEHVNISHYIWKWTRVRDGIWLLISWPYDNVNFLDHPGDPSVIIRVRIWGSREAEKSSSEVMWCQKDCWPLLALKREGSTTRWMWIASRSWKDKETNVVLEPPEGKFCQLLIETHFIFLTSRNGTINLICFKPLIFLVICYKSNKN